MKYESWEVTIALWERSGVRGNWCRRKWTNTAGQLPLELSTDVLIKCSDSTKPVPVTRASPSFRNNVLRAAQLAGKIFSPNAKILSPLDWLPTVLERGKVFWMPKNWVQTVSWDYALLILARQRLPFRKGSTFGFLCWRMQKMYWSTQTERGILRLRNIALSQLRRLANEPWNL